jgi:hypothetical protein
MASGESKIRLYAGKEHIVHSSASAPGCHWPSWPCNVVCSPTVSLPSCALSPIASLLPEEVYSFTKEPLMIALQILQGERKGASLT